jgi:pimeloyl-ACP methyl ester carboxylesterase
MHELAYNVTGSGPALLLVPGTGSTVRDTWGATVEALSASHTVIMPDLPGTGTSPLADCPLDAATLGAQLVDVVQRAGHEQFTALGSRRPPGLQTQIELARTIDATDALEAIRMPALVIGAKDDQFVDPAHSQHLADSLGHAQMMMLKGSHGLGHEQPLVIAQAINDLVAG